ncbi:Conserved_hypothetical protein [Hexamita inflata]|uniref:Uncharacterized protein n=1 Tax=Hexamita inflata TaxID=28002 RepID=A0AA86PFD1_9EUKA|nr:Conserved hypothetical protein [Hexamita inflata]
MSKEYITQLNQEFRQQIVDRKLRIQMKPFLIPEFFNGLDLEQLTIVQCMKFTLEQIPTNLSQLQIRDCALSNLNGICAMKNLKTLTVQHSRTQDISDLRELNLEALYMDENKIENIEALEKMSKLQVLYLASNQIQKIQSLQNLIGITHLDLSKNKLTHIRELANLVNITELYLLQNEISDISPLIKLKKLAILNMSRNLVIDAYTLLYLRNLQVIDLSQNQICDLYFFDQQYNSINRLFLDKNYIEDITPLFSHPNLHKYCLKDQNKPNNSILTLSNTYKQIHLQIERIQFMKNKKLKTKTNRFKKQTNKTVWKMKLVTGNLAEKFCAAFSYEANDQ